MSQLPEVTSVTIALLTPDFAPKTGGIANVLEGLVRATSLKYRWHVFTTCQANGTTDSSMSYPITRLTGRVPGERPGDDLYPLRKINSFFHHLGAPRAARALFDEIRATVRPEFVVFGCWDHSTSYWCSAARDAGIPYWLFAHGLEVTGLRGWFMNRRRIIDFQCAVQIVANSEATAQRVRGLGVPERGIAVIHPGVNVESLVPLPIGGVKDVLTSVGLDGVPFLLSMGRLVKRKGFDLTISAFASLAHEFPELHFVLAGDGPERKQLESIASTLDIRHRIHILGRISERVKAGLLQSCEYFVLANREVRGDMEGFGLVFREAAHFGKACIGGNNGGVPEAILDGRTGLLVDTSAGDRPLADAMRELLCSPGRARGLGQNGEREVANSGTMRQSAKRFGDLVETRRRGGDRSTAEDREVPPL